MNQITEAAPPRHIDCTMAEYHARSELSNSQCAAYVDPKRGPLYFYGVHIATPPLVTPEKTAALEFGTATHQLFSSPGRIDEVAIEIPEEVLTKAGAKNGNNWHQWKADHPGLVHLKAEEMQRARAMVRRVHEHPVASRLFSTAIHLEHTLVWTDAETGLGLRARLDLFSGLGGEAIPSDFKTTRAKTPREFAWDAKKFGYHRQAAWYSEPLERLGYDVPGFFFITSDTSGYNACRVYELDPADIALGMEEIRRARREIAGRMESTDVSGEDAWRSELDRMAKRISLFS